MNENGVGLIINPGCDLATSRKALELAHQYAFLYAAVGYHPENCGTFVESDLGILRALAQDPKVVAIGEIGLDYYWEENPPREFQQKVFRLQMTLARELDLPVIVHDREAHADSLAVVKEFPDVRGVFHCYSGSVEMARELWKRGWYIGIDGPVTYKNARRLIEVVREVPLERILLETDSPYMAPVPCRGERNDSAKMQYIAQKIGQLRGMETEAVAEQTMKNGKELFRI